MGVPNGGQREIGPDGYPDDNYIPFHADTGCKLHETCLTCPLATCVEEFRSTGQNTGLSPFTRALAHHIKSGGVLTERMVSVLPVSLGGRSPRAQEAGEEVAA